MQNPLQLTGIHHLTAVFGHMRENYRFYTQVLGMRLVKRSVNQDDVSAYHLFYADAVGSAGTDLTFFDWNMPQSITKIWRMAFCSVYASFTITQHF